MKWIGCGSHLTRVIHRVGDLSDEKWGFVLDNRRGNAVRHSPLSSCVGWWARTGSKAEREQGRKAERSVILRRAV